MESTDCIKFNPLDHPIIFSYPERLLESSAWIEHIPFAMFLTDILKPKVFVELGTHTGVSYSTFCQAIQELKLDTKAYAIDTWQGDEHAGYYGDEIYKELADFISTRYGGFSTLIRSSFDDAIEQFADRSIDLLHIDGLHTYEAVKHDFESWKPKLSDQAVVIFHDTAELQGDFGVWKLWRELKETYPSLEFLHGHGLGVIAFGQSVPRKFLEILNNPGWHSAIRDLFSSLGERLEKAKDINGQNKRIAEKDNQIASLKEQNEKNSQEILEIHNSETWKVGSLFGKFFRKIFPIGSKRRNFLSLLKNKLNSIAEKNPQLKKIIPSVLTTDNEQISYQLWINNNEPAANVLEEQKIKAALFQRQPLISIVMPVFNTQADILKEAIDSVINQTYPKWELCIANGSPDNQQINTLLEFYRTIDSRILYKNLSSNEGIAGNTNAAISMATGEYIAFLDHDNLLAPFALFSIARTINKEPSADLIYSDEDKITEDGKKRFFPFFKPDYSPDYLRTNNYICHFLVIRKSIGDDLGWVRAGFEGAQDFDLILRVSEKARKIIHIPQILYHWRAIHGSTAQTTDAKGYASMSGLKAVKEHIDRIGLKGETVMGPVPTSYRVKADISQMPLVSIIIPNHDHADDLKKCVNSILNKSSYKNFELLIIENNSQENKTFAYYKELEKTEKIKIFDYSFPFNYSEINNFAVQKAEGEHLIFLNNDTEVTSEDWIEQMLQFSIRPDVAFVGAKLFYPDHTIQHAGIIIGLGGVAEHAHLHEPGDSPGYGLSLINSSAKCFSGNRRLYDGQ